MTSRRHIARAATVGMFDGVHLGHKQVVEQLCAIARRRGLQPMVVTFDRHPLCRINPARAPKMLSTVEQKSRLLVDYGAEEVVVMIFDDALRNLTAGEFIALLHDRYDVELLLVGHDHRFGRGRAESFDDYCRIGKACGVTMVRENELVLPGTDLPLCSSSVRKALSDGDITLATTLLGHSFAIHGRVGHGRNIGHTIGFPTANLLPFLPDQQLPAPGVYAGVAEIQGGRRYPAMINIGTNPTVSDDGRLKIEAHLIGYEGDLYDTLLDLTFTRRLRDERKFPSLDALKSQLQA
ncbi:MAG: riboflavin biosynthesis protein RibF, partial [Muribaculaceae bacterium]|nr:riboflavin biosynthesis protein RibF [Muribaculaceae bacterium]